MPWCNKCKPWLPPSKACNPGASQQHHFLRLQFNRSLLQADFPFKVRTLKSRPPSGESTQSEATEAGHSLQKLSRFQGNLHPNEPLQRSSKMTNSTRRSRSWSAKSRHSTEENQDVMATSSLL